MHTTNAKNAKQKSGFTLIELLIVVVIIATLAAIVAPKFGEAVGGSNTAAVKQSTRILQSAIDRYHAEHGFYPGTNTSGMGCSGIDNYYGQGGVSLYLLRNRLVLYTNAAGAMCDTRTDSTGETYSLGPYISKDLPLNASNGLREVYLSTTDPTATTDLSAYGWVYNQDTGTVRSATDWD